ncbi:T9SS C-terminal target domain-containing protein, partial [bacterium]
YSVSGPTKEWRKASKVNVNGTTVTGIKIYVVPMLRTSTGYSAIRGSVQSATRPSNSLGKLGATVGIEGSLVYAVESTSGQVAGYGVTNTDGSFTVAELAPGTYIVTVDKLDYSSSSITASPTYDATTGAAVSPTVSLNIDAVLVTEAAQEPLVPANYLLEQNYPNPFNPSTQILFGLPQLEKVSLTIYNVLGQKLATLVDGILTEGTHVVTWNGRDSRGLQLPSGVYFYLLKTSNFTATKRMILMK